MQDRRPERLPTNIKGTYRTPRGFECDVDVDDLSLGGCRVDDLRGGLMLGEYVQITLGEAGPFVAEVVWRQSTRVGLQFNRSLPAHIVKDLTGVDVKAQPDASALPPRPSPFPASAPDPFAPTAPSAQKPAPKPPGLRRFL